MFAKNYDDKIIEKNSIFKDNKLGWTSDMKDFTILLNILLIPMIKI